MKRTALWAVAATPFMFIVSLSVAHIWNTGVDGAIHVALAAALVGACVAAACAMHKLGL